MSTKVKNDSFEVKLINDLLCRVTSQGGTQILVPRNNVKIHQFLLKMHHDFPQQDTWVEPKHTIKYYPDIIGRPFTKIQKSLCTHLELVRFIKARVLHDTKLVYKKFETIHPYQKVQIMLE